MNIYAHLLRGTLHEYLCAFMVISLSVLLRTMFQTTVVEKMKTHMLCSTHFLFGNRTVYDITCKNTVETDRPHMTIWRTAYWIPKATNTHPDCVILIDFLLQKCLHEHASMLRYTYTACPGILRFFISTHTNISRHN